MKHPVLQVLQHEGEALGLDALMADLAQRLAGRRGDACIGIRCEPLGQWVIDLRVGLVRGSSASLEVDERDDLDLVIEGPAEMVTVVLNGQASAAELEAVVLRGSPNALEELLSLL